MARDPHALGEFDLIDRLTAGLDTGDPAVRVGVGDDCAVIDDGGDGPLLVTCDLMAEGVHFLSGAKPVALGDKLLAVNISDIAAMGGRPAHALLALAIAPGVDVGYLERVYAGLDRRARRHGVSLVGGDTTASRSGLVLSLTLLGRGSPGRVLTRDAARPGDRILVSGTLGDSGAGLLLLSGAGDDPPDLSREHADQLRQRHILPEPRVELGLALAALDGVHAAIDISDGLASDLGHICRRSRVGARVDLDRIPLSAPLRSFAADPLALAIGAGEDYELCVTVSPAAAGSVLAAAATVGVPLTDVGEIVEGEGIVWRSAGTTVDPPASGGWDHFAAEKKD
jgi:thiamine-monophosphate kinase